MRDDSSKIRSDGAPTSPIKTFPCVAAVLKPLPTTTVSEPLVVSILKSVLLADWSVVVATVQANGELFLMVVVATAEVKSKYPPVMDNPVVEA